MSPLIQTQNTSLKGKVPILIITFFGLFCKLLCFPAIFFIYEGINPTRLRFVFPSLINLLCVAATIASFVLLLVYILFLHRRGVGKILIPIAYLCLASSYVFSAVNYLNTFFKLSQYDEVRIMLVYGAIYAVVALFYTFAIISAFSGLNNKVFVVISGVLVLLYIFGAFISSVLGIYPVYIKNEFYLFLFTIPLNYLGDISINLAMMLFGVMNTLLIAKEIQIFEQSNTSVTSQSAEEFYYNQG